MGKFHINKLTFTGTKGISEITFGENLTLIFGPSDTGKTYVFKSIYYLLGSSNKNAPFDTSIGYDTISMEVRKDNSHITLTRKIGENKILVNDGIKNKIYKVSGKTTTICT
jgi:predicted ATP-binding protein involved in virulence